MAVILEVDDEHTRGIAWSRRCATEKTVSLRSTTGRQEGSLRRGAAAVRGSISRMSAPTHGNAGDDDAGAIFEESRPNGLVFDLEG